jgi:hypothetical protein
MINKSMIIFQAIGATFVTVIGTGMVCRAIPYKEGFGIIKMYTVSRCMTKTLMI